MVRTKIVYDDQLIFFYIETEETYNFMNSIAFPKLGNNRIDINNIIENNLNNQDILLCIGCCYLSGEYFRKDYTLARKYFELCYNKFNNLIALSNLLIYDIYNENVKEYLIKIIDIYEKIKNEYLLINICTIANRYNDNDTLIKYSKFICEIDMGTMDKKSIKFCCEFIRLRISILKYITEEECEFIVNNNEHFEFLDILISDIFYEGDEYKYDFDILVKLIPLIENNIKDISNKKTNKTEFFFEYFIYLISKKDMKYKLLNIVGNACINNMSENLIYNLIEYNQLETVHDNEYKFSLMYAMYKIIKNKNKDTLLSSQYKDKIIHLFLYIMNKINTCTENSYLYILFTYNYMLRFLYKIFPEIYSFSEYGRLIECFYESEKINNVCGYLLNRNNYSVKNDMKMSIFNDFHIKSCNEFDSKYGRLFPIYNNYNEYYATPDKYIRRMFYHKYGYKMVQSIYEVEFLDPTMEICKYYHYFSPDAKKSIFNLFVMNMDINNPYLYIIPKEVLFIIIMNFIY